MPEVARDVEIDDPVDTSSQCSAPDVENVDILLNLPEQNGSSKLAEVGVHSNYNNLRNQSRPVCNVVNGNVCKEIDPLPGEKFEKYDDVLCDCDLYFSTYRIVIATKNRDGFAVIPSVALDTVEAKDIVYLHLNCKDGHIIRLKATTGEAACTLYKKFTQLSTTKRELLKDLYAYNFRKEVAHSQQKLSWIKDNAGGIKDANKELKDLDDEFKYLNYDASKWRITEANDQFKLCRTYPQYLIVPKSVSDEELGRVHNGRFFSRFPVAVWKCKQSGGVLLRSAQPTISWLGAANEDDVRYIDSIYNTVSSNPGEKKQKLLIVDARSYTAAWANRAKKGGFEGSDTYVNSDVEFMALPNIHNIRYSFVQLRTLAHSFDDDNYFANLNNTQWFQCQATLLRTAIRCSEALFSGRSVLVHCSDGWDRTAQIISLCKVISDPYYRSFEGFQYLVQRDWVGFGHKFADRNGVLNDDPNERSPIFLQWVDCIYQLWQQNPTEFQFNKRYLMKLVQHSYSGLFGTFLFNCIADASAYGVQAGREDVDESFIVDDAIELFSVWDYLNEKNEEFVNVSYKQKRIVLKCKASLPHLVLWSDLYRCTESESVVNNIVDENSVSPSATVTVQGQIDPDRISNISRSQSASSLVSMNDVHGVIHSMPSHNPPVYSMTSGSSHFNSISASMNRLSLDATSSCNWKNNIDVDGLIRVPMPLDDGVLRLVFYLHGQNQQGPNGNENSKPVKLVQEPQIDGFGAIPRHHANGTQSGVNYRNTQMPRLNGYTNGESASPCADTENVPTRGGERISVK